LRLTFTISRFNPEIDRHPHVEDYRVEVGRGMTVLDALIRIKNQEDGSLAFRYSCRSAICGSSWVIWRMKTLVSRYSS